MSRTSPVFRVPLIAFLRLPSWPDYFLYFILSLKFLRESFTPVNHFPIQFSPHRIPSAQQIYLPLGASALLGKALVRVSYRNLQLREPMRTGGNSLALKTKNANTAITESIGEGLV